MWKTKETPPFVDQFPGKPWTFHIYRGSRARWIGSLERRRVEPISCYKPSYCAKAARSANSGHQFSLGITDNFWMTFSTFNLLEIRFGQWHPTKYPRIIIDLSYSSIPNDIQFDGSNSPKWVMFQSRPFFQNPSRRQNLQIVSKSTIIKILFFSENPEAPWSTRHSFIPSPISPNFLEIAPKSP